MKPGEDMNHYRVLKRCYFVMFDRKNFNEMIFKKNNGTIVFPNLH